MYKIGADIGGTKINIGILDNENNLVANKKIYIKNITNLPQSVKETIASLASENSIDYDDIEFCGVGIPGTVSEDGRKIIKAPNISILGENVASQMEAVIGLPVALVQDSRAAAWGEYLCGAGRGGKTVVCVTLGTGIGTGIVIDGKIYNGALGCAGELGHIPVQENGRECGCGKRGCLEKYCAGGGLDITAREIYGRDATAQNLFDDAKKGDKRAIEEISKAVSMLGGGLVSIINLLSPDYLLFSGGLSAQEELYLNPLIEYIKAHCYDSGVLPNIKKAELGENSPLIGAALIPYSPKRQQLLSASIMCADVLNFGRALEEIEKSGIEYIHCDIMDNHFVPNLMLPPELLCKLHEHSNLPFDYHIMAEKPETIVERLMIKEGDMISVHYEGVTHLQSVLNMIREKGARACVAINPSTPINVLDEVLDYLDFVLIMTVNPGFSGQKIVPTSFDKIRRMRKTLDYKGYKNIVIEVDGNCSFGNVPKMYKAGAEMFVVGTSSVFKTNVPIADGVEKLKKLLCEA